MSVPEPLFVEETRHALPNDGGASMEMVPISRKTLNPKCEWVMGAHDEACLSTRNPSESCTCDDQFPFRLPKIYVIPEGAELQRVMDGRLHRVGDFGSDCVRWDQCAGHSGGYTNEEAWAWEDLVGGLTQEGSIDEPVVPDGFYWLYESSAGFAGDADDFVNSKIETVWRLTPIEAEPVSESLRNAMMEDIATGDPRVIHHCFKSLLQRGLNPLHGLLFVHLDGPDAGMAEMRG